MNEIRRKSPSPLGKEEIVTANDASGESADRTSRRTYNNRDLGLGASQTPKVKEQPHSVSTLKRPNPTKNAAVGNSKNTTMYPSPANALESKIYSDQKINAIISKDENSQTKNENADAS